VTFAERLPATAHPQALIELGTDAAVSAPPGAPADAKSRAPFREVTIAAVDPSYFDVLQAPLLAGRAFTAADARPGAGVVIVDEGFADQVLQGRNPIGQQVRFATNDPAKPNPWNEIVGLVKELGVGTAPRRGRAAGFYIPATPDLFDEAYMIVHARGGDPMALGAPIREIATAVDPALRLVEFQRADQVTSGIVWIFGLFLSITVAMSAVALVLSLAGIYAVLSFTVSRRTREIGIRVALGASRQRVIATIFRRPLLQMVFGVFAGTSIIFTVARLLKSTEFPGSETGLSTQAIAMIVAYAIVMVGVCLLACIVPTRRALRVEPTVALRMD
jgi:putative ABC transport system permease protein